MLLKLKSFCWLTIHHTLCISNRERDWRSTKKEGLPPIVTIGMVKERKEVWGVGKEWISCRSWWEEFSKSIFAFWGFTLEWIYGQQSSCYCSNSELSRGKKCPEKEEVHTLTRVLSLISVGLYMAKKQNQTKCFIKLWHKYFNCSFFLFFSKIGRIKLQLKCHHFRYWCAESQINCTIRKMPLLTI